MNQPEAHAASAPFRTCGMCRKTWATREDFLEDPGIRLLGLQAVPELADANVLVFEHECGTSVSVLAHKLRDLLAPAEAHDATLPLLYGTEACQKLCTNIASRSTCDRPCRNAYDRRLSTGIADRKERLRAQRATATSPLIALPRSSGGSGRR